MKMLVSMLFLGVVRNGAAVLRPVALTKKDRELSLSPAVGAWPSSARETITEDRVSFDRDIDFDALDEPNQGMLDHFTMAQTLPGRMALNAAFVMHKASTLLQQQAPSVAKRALDIVCSAILLLCLAPLFALIAILVKLEDGGPVFFAQTRVGRFGRQFKMYKVRSMCIDAEKKLQGLLGKNEHKEGVTFKLKDDPRITRVGKWLRKFSMDELPQLYNVLIGNMSLVGPRPPLPLEVEKYSLADRRRLVVTPGITCIWQISGRSEIDFSGQVKLDVHYIENQNLVTDFRILLKTLPVVISGRGAC